MKKILLLILLLISFKSNSQNDVYDYFVNKNNDTIYGAIELGFLNHAILRQKNNSNKSNGIKFYKHTVKGIKLFKYNDRIYKYEKPKPSYQEDPIYGNSIKKESEYHSRVIGNFINKSLKLDDFIVTNNNDTIYGKIFEPLLGKPYLSNDLDEKYKITIKTVKSFRHQNELYSNFSKIKKKYDFLKLVTDGDAKLFVDEHYKSINKYENIYKPQIKNPDSFYIYINNQIIPIGYIKFKKQMQELFNDNKVLIEKIKEEEFIYQNLTLIVKFYNETK